MQCSEVNWSIFGFFVLVHVVTGFAVTQVNFTGECVAWAVGVYCVRWLGFTCALHRYFSHKVCKTSRWFQLVLAVWGTMTMARGPIRFASGHRHHHIYSDTDRDLHSAKKHGVISAYLGWVVSKRYNENLLGRVGDLKRYPELRLVNSLYFIPNVVLIWALYTLFGPQAMVYGGLVSIVLVWHTAFSVTVLFHQIGQQSYETFDESKNSGLLALFTFGEGWHNNHHANMGSANLGHERYQIDIGYWLFLGLEKLGLVWDLNKSTEPRVVKRKDRTPALVGRPSSKIGVDEFDTELARRSEQMVA